MDKIGEHMSLIANHRQQSIEKKLTFLLRKPNWMPRFMYEWVLRNMVTSVETTKNVDIEHSGKGFGAVWMEEAVEVSDEQLEAVVKLLNKKK